MFTFELKHKYVDHMTDEEFFQFCQEQRDMRIERDAQGNIIIMAPTDSITGEINSEVTCQVANWNHKKKMGRVLGSSAGFILSDGSMCSPDTSWVSSGKASQLTPEQRRVFPPICPEFVIEIKSFPDRLIQLQKKMQAYIANGALLGWLIDPDNETVEIYRADGSIDMITGFDGTVSGENVLPDFNLNLPDLRVA